MPFGVREVRGLAAILVLSATALNAQKVTGWQCRIDPSQPGHSGACSGDDDCNARYRKHLCDWHQQCSATGSEAPAPDVRRMSLGKTMFLFGGSGAVLGAAIGGAGDVGKSDEQKQADKDVGKPPGVVQGAIIGTGIGVTMAVFAKALVASKVRSTGVVPAWVQRTTISVLPSRRAFWLSVRW